MPKAAQSNKDKQGAIELQIAAHEWAEFLYAEYQREKDKIRLYKMLGKVAAKGVK
jgi:hypothetical protein